MNLFLRFFFCSLLFSSASLFSQTKFQRVYGGVDSLQDGLDIKQTSDGGYIINGRITTFKANAACEDGYLIKTNSAGIMTWSKRYGTPSCWEGKSIVQTTDGGYFFAGENKSWSYGGPGDFDVYAVKVTSSGAVQWEKDLGDIRNDGAYAVQQTTDGGYMCFGITADVASNGYDDYYLIKLDNAGTVQWSKTYGGTYLDFGFDARQTQDGGYIMTGSSYSFGSGMAVYVTKADVNGTVQWGTAINGPSDDYSYGVYQTNDGGYLVAGGTDSYGVGGNDVFLIRLNSAGGVTWTKTYGAGSGECGFCVRQTTDGGFAVCGGTNSIGNGGYDLFLLKTDSNGNLLWTKTYGGTGDEGPSGGMFFAFNIITDRTVKMDLTSDGGFAITSLTNSFPGGNIYFVKTDANGNSGCNETNGTFLSTTPTPTVIAYTGTTLPTTQTSSPASIVTTPATIDSNACQCTLPVPLVNSNTTICQSQNTTLTASGGTTYAWSNGMTASTISVSPSVTTTYSVIVSNSCGSAKDSVKVIVNPLPTANVSPNVTICPGDNVTLSGTGTGTYLWNPTGQTTSSISVSPTATSTYIFSVTNACGTTNKTTTVTISSSITASISGNTSICSGSSATLNANGGTSYSWSTTATTSSIIVSPTTATTYSLVAYSGSCSDTASVTVNVTQTPVANIASNTTICSGQTVTLTASGGGTYSWNTAAVTSSISVSPSSTSTYSVLVSNGNCSSTASATVTVNPNPVPVISGNTLLCTGDVTTLTASGGTTYSWSNGMTTTSIILTPSTTTTYTLTATNSSCSAATTVTVSVLLTPTASVTSNTTICAGHNATLTASGGGNYLWNTGATTSSITPSPTSSTTYSVIVSVGSCSDTASAIITVNANPTAAISGNTTLCIGSTATLTANGGGNYSWSNGSTTATINVSPTSSSNYSVTVTNANNCSATATISVIVSPAPNTTITGTITLCQGHTTTLTANGGGNYSWNTGATTPSITVNTSGNYSVVVSVGSCKDSAFANISVNTNPIANTSADVTISQGNSTTLTASGGGTYSWSNGTNGATDVVSPNITTGYCVTVTNANGCTDSACVTVFVKPIDCPEELYVPNAFSPNNDNDNDFFMVYFVNVACVKEFKMDIYDRWGEKILQSTDPSFKWAGDYKGTVMNTAVFVYYLYVRFDNGDVVNKKGNVSLVR